MNSRTSEADSTPDGSTWRSLQLDWHGRGWRSKRRGDRRSSKRSFNRSTTHSDAFTDRYQTQVLLIGVSQASTTVGISQSPLHGNDTEVVPATQGPTQKALIRIFQLLQKDAFLAPPPQQSHFIHMQLFAISLCAEQNTQREAHRSTF